MTLPHEDFWETPLPPDDFARREEEGRARLLGPEGDEMRATIAWFVRRYPTPLARLAYIRRKTREAKAFQARVMRSSTPR